MNKVLFNEIMLDRSVCIALGDWILLCTLPFGAFTPVDADAHRQSKLFLRSCQISSLLKRSVPGLTCRLPALPSALALLQQIGGPSSGTNKQH